jgi:DNA-binding XRE family transcriptional regulator
MTQGEQSASKVAEDFTFYLGTHHPHWLASLSVPLCVSRRRLLTRKSPWPRARVSWVLDSGAYSELSLFGGWSIGSARYAEEVRRYTGELGVPEWVAPQDWMCEEDMLRKTGKSLREHQRLTVRSYFELRDLAPEQPWIPVLQGYSVDDYLRCAEDYEKGGLDLRSLSTVGLGSVCRRQSTDEIVGLLRGLEHLRLKIHGFGVKTLGLGKVGHLFRSTDSLSWSKEAWKGKHLHPRCVGGNHKNCANCPIYALWWRRRLMRQIGRVSREVIPDMVALGKVLAEGRRSQGRSQMEVAAEIGTSAQALGQVERGWRKPSREWLERLADEVGVVLDAECSSTRGASS